MTSSILDQREELRRRCQGAEMSIARGPELDERIIFIRSDGSAWGESTAATCIDELDAEELALALAHVEPADLADQGFIQECAYWRHVPGFQAWLSGGAHPAELAPGRAIGLRQGAFHIDRDFQRITLNGHPALVPEDAFARLLADEAMLALALDDPRGFVQEQRGNLAAAWSETTFAQPIFFSADALPAIAAEESILARRLGSGCWLFEHPKLTQWLCRMEASSNTVTTRLHLHNGMPVRDFKSDPGE